MTDIEDWSSPAKLDLHRRAMRDGLHESLNAALGDIGIDRQSCDTNDTGDGLIVLTSPNVEPLKLVDDLPKSLAAQLQRYNATHATAAQIRLRMAVNVGVIQQDDHGHNGRALTLACRLLDTQELRDELRNSADVLAIILPDTLYDDVVIQDPAADPDSYRHTVVEVKGGRETAWLRTR